MAAVAHPTGDICPKLMTIVLDTNFVPPLTGLWVGAAGSVALVDTDGNTRTIVGIAAGTQLRCGIQRVNTVDTTVASPTTNIIGLR